MSRNTEHENNWKQRQSYYYTIAKEKWPRKKNSYNDEKL